MNQKKKVYDEVGQKGRGGDEGTGQRRDVNNEGLGLTHPSSRSMRRIGGS